LKSVRRNSANSAGFVNPGPDSARQPRTLHSLSLPPFFSPSHTSLRRSRSRGRERRLNQTRRWTAAVGWAGSGGPRRRRPRSGASRRCLCCIHSSPRTGSPSPSSRAPSGGRSPAPSSSVSTPLLALPPRMLRSLLSLLLQLAAVRQY
jgi:hypothetical protein